MRVLLVAMTLLAPLSLAGHTSNAPVCPNDRLFEVTGGSADTTAYVDLRDLVRGGGIWLYVESNGHWIPKLPGVYTGEVADEDVQRGGASSIFPGDPENCVDLDTLLYGPEMLVF